MLHCHRPALCAIAHQDRATQYSETAVIEPRGRGVLVPRLRGDDGCGVRHLHVIPGLAQREPGIHLSAEPVVTWIPRLCQRDRIPE